MTVTTPDGIRAMPDNIGPQEVVVQAGDINATIVGTPSTTIEGTPAVTVSGTPPSTAIPGGTLPTLATVVAGSDGSAVRVLKTDTDGTLDVDITKGAHIAVRNAVLPASVAVVAGSDGTNARPVLTDATGKVQVAVTNTPAVTISGTPAVTISNTPSVTISGTPPGTGAPGSATPALAEATAGSDGTNLRVLRVDTDGTQQVNLTKSPLLATPGAAVPAGAAIIAGSDGTNARTMLTDSIGRQQVNVQTVTTLPQVSPVLQTSAYAAGNLLFVSQAITVLRAAGTGAILQDFTLIDFANKQGAINFLFFKAALTSTLTLGATPTINAADMANFLYEIQVLSSDYNVVGSGAVVTNKTSLGKVVVPTSGTQIFCIALAAGAVTYASASAGAAIQFNIGVLQD